ncbi:MAG: sulfatase, partial [Planctomycetota bacterium]
GVKFLEQVHGIEQAPMEGVSMAYSFNDAKAPTPKKVQYYELFGHRALWKDGWKIVTRHGGIMPWDINNPHVPFDNDKWELYNLGEDASEANDLADKMPEKVAELAKLWEEEAVKHNVFPVDDGKGTRAVRTFNRIAAGKTEYTYYAPGAYGIQESLAPQVKNVSHTVQTTLDLKGDEDGVIACMGGLSGGWSLFIKDHQVYYVYNSLGTKEFAIKSGPLPKGKTDIVLTYEKKDKLQGQVDLLINGKKMDSTTIGPAAYTFFSMDETFDVGRDTGTTVQHAVDAIKSAVPN